MLINERFVLDTSVISNISKDEIDFGFSGFGELVYYTHYSRLKKNGLQEKWIDTCKRVVEGVMSIRKSWYNIHNLKWDNTYWSNTANSLLYYMYTMKILPPGRSLWAGGTDYVYERGSMALNNCAATTVEFSSLENDIGWIMDALMCGTGVGLKPVINKDDKLNNYLPASSYEFKIPDSREGWVESVVQLIKSFKDNISIKFDYSAIRNKGDKIAGFGGVSSGVEPLILLHDRIREYMLNFCNGTFDFTRLVADIANAVGSCVVAGNTRRSAELILGSPDDDTFKNLSDYIKFPEREEIGWMSNNTWGFDTKQDFQKLDEISDIVVTRGEGGIVNFRNIRKYGRFGDVCKPDNAVCPNPCGEIGLDNKELCNLFEIFPHKAKNKKEFLDMCRIATIYATSISLLPTHNEETNYIVAKNRRIGISLSGVADWFDFWGGSRIISFMREGYDEIRKYADFMNEQAGIPSPIRVTTVKPSGSVSQLAGVSPGMHFPLFTHAVRRMRLSKGSPILKLCAEAGLHIEEDVYDKDYTKVVEFPIYTGKTRPSHDVTAWEQFSMLALLQREWSDNMVSCTIHFTEEEKKDIPRMLAYFMPVIKSASFLLKRDAIYKQMPYEEITESEYNNKIKNSRKIDWSKFNGSDGEESKFCSNESCEL